MYTAIQNRSNPFHFSRIFVQISQNILVGTYGLTSDQRKGYYRRKAIADDLGLIPRDGLET